MIHIYFQAILASAFAKNDYDKAAAAASRVLQVLNNTTDIFKLYQMRYHFLKFHRYILTAVRIGFGVGACIHARSGVAVWSKVIYKRCQCPASYWHRHTSKSFCIKQTKYF